MAKSPVGLFIGVFRLDLVDDQASTYPNRFFGKTQAFRALPCLVPPCW